MPAFSFVPFVDGNVLTAALLNAPFQALKTLIETTKFDASNLQLTKSIQNFAVTEPSHASGVTVSYRFKTSTAVISPLEVQVSYDTEAGATSVSLDVFDETAGASILSGGPVANAVVDTVANATAFNVNTIPVGHVLRLDVTVGANNVTGVLCNFIYKATLQG